MIIVRLLIAGFASFVGGVCYLTGLKKLMSALLLAFGCIISLFFGIIFLIPNSENILGFPVFGLGGSWPFFLLAAVLACGAIIILLKERVVDEYEVLSAQHGKFLVFGLLGCVTAIFCPAFFWFPSEERRLAVAESALGLEVFIGTLVFIVLFFGSLYLLYRASLGGTEGRPDFMQRVVLAIFAVLQLEKIPALIAYLLIYSPETQIIFPAVAAFALASYVGVGIFFWFTGSRIE